MKMIEDNDRRTVLLFRPPTAMPMTVCLAVLFFTGWGWHATQSWKWFAAVVVAMGFVIMILLAVCFNRRVLTFDWQQRCVDGRLHNWNPLFKDEVEHHSLKDMAHWTLGQERKVIGKAGRFWQVGFEGTNGRTDDELFFERTFSEAHRKILLLARHNSKPVVVRSVYDTLRHEDPHADQIVLAHETDGMRTETEMALSQSLTDRRMPSYAHSGLQINGEGLGALDVSLVTDRRQMRGKFGPIRRWPFMLIEGILCLFLGACFPFLQRHPHSFDQLVLVCALVALPIFLAGVACLWVGIRDLFGRTRIEIRSGRVRLTQTVLGIPHRTKEDSVRKWGGAIVSKLGYNPCLLILFCDKEYRIGVGVNPAELLRVRRALNHAALSQ